MENSFSYIPIVFKVILFLIIIFFVLIRKYFILKLDCAYCAGMGGLHSNIKSLDLSHNNISQVSRAFFRPAELSLTHLRMSHNSLRNATWDVFGNMPHLQWLDLRRNNLREIGWDAFRNTKRLQVSNSSLDY